MSDQLTLKEQFLQDQAKALEALRLQVGQFYEINGLCYVVRKLTKKDVCLRRFSGTLAVPKVHATALQLKHARPL